MRAETARRCVAEITRFLRAWEEIQMRYAEEKEVWHLPAEGKSPDWLAWTTRLNKERAALRRASLDLSQALADLRQGR